MACLNRILQRWPLSCMPELGECTSLPGTAAHHSHIMPRMLLAPPYCMTCWCGRLDDHSPWMLNYFVKDAISFRIVGLHRVQGLGFRLKDISLVHRYNKQPWLLFTGAALHCRSLLLEGAGASGSKAVTGKVVSLQQVLLAFSCSACSLHPAFDSSHWSG